jgi:hypothetical protein
MLRLRTEENLLERVFIEIADMSRPVVILAITRHGQIAIHREVVFGFALKRGADEALSPQLRRPFEVKLLALAHDVADHPVDATAFGFDERHVAALRGGARRWNLRGSGHYERQISIARISVQPTAAAGQFSTAGRPMFSAERITNGYVQSSCGWKLIG